MPEHCLKSLLHSDFQAEHKMYSWDIVKMNFSERLVCISAARVFRRMSISCETSEFFGHFDKGAHFVFIDCMKEISTLKGWLNMLSPTTHQGQNGPRH